MPAERRGNVIECPICGYLLDEAEWAKEGGFQPGQACDHVGDVERLVFLGCPEGHLDAEIERVGWPAVEQLIDEYADDLSEYSENDPINNLGEDDESDDALHHQLGQIICNAYHNHFEVVWSDANMVGLPFAENPDAAMEASEQELRQRLREFRHQMKNPFRPETKGWQAFEDARGALFESAERGADPQDEQREER
jgi:hypothetical protein